MKIMRPLIITTLLLTGWVARAGEESPKVMECKLKAHSHFLDLYVTKNDMFADAWNNIATSTRDQALLSLALVTALQVGYSQLVTEFQRCEKVGKRGKGEAK